MSNKFFEVKNLTKKVDDSFVLDKLSFHIPENSIVGFLGKNGSGKTTTLKTIGNITPMDSGNIKLEGKPISSNQIMFLPDTPLVYPVLTGQEYLSFMSDIFNINSKDYSHYTKILQLDDFLDKKISEYSLGMKKKKFLIPMLLKKPRVLLLDELFSSIDPVSVKDIKIVLKQYVTNGNSIILTTHQLDVAQKICNYVILIDKGKIIAPIMHITKVLEKEKGLESYFLNHFA